MSTLTFSDNFSSLSLWNGTSGTWATNYWYNPLDGNGGSLPTNGEQEWYINANDTATSAIVPWTVQNGILTITGAAAPASIQPLINNYQYTSGELNTYHSFSQTYGYFEGRMELPAGQGLWPAFWMIPENGSWPPEIDIMEVLGNNPTQLYTSLHSGTASNEISSGQATTVPDTSKAYHEYAVDWTPTTITFYFDNKAVYSAPTPSDMNVPMYMEINLAMGGYWPGNIDSTTKLPAEMRVADVAVWSSNPGTGIAPTTFTADNTPGQVLIGAPGNDIFHAGTSSAIMTGDGLTNTYVWSALPTATPQITDFDPGVDTIDVGGLLQAVGYAGTNPFGDGTLSLVSDGKNGTDVNYNHNGSSTTIVELDNVDPSQVTSSSFIIASSGSGTSGGSGTSSGETLIANNHPHQVLTATTPNDTFYAGTSSVIMTEDGGSNTFIYTTLPNSAGQITNFNPATDIIDVARLLTSVNYAGTDPFGDGTLSLASDGHGGTNLFYNPPGSGSHGIKPAKIVDIDHVPVSGLAISKDFVVH